MTKETNDNDKRTHPSKWWPFIISIEITSNLKRRHCIFAKYVRCRQCVQVLHAWWWHVPEMYCAVFVPVTITSAVRMTTAAELTKKWCNMDTQRRHLCICSSLFISTSVIHKLTIFSLNIASFSRYCFLILPHTKHKVSINIRLLFKLAY